MSSPEITENRYTVIKKAIYHLFLRYCCCCCCCRCCSKFFQQKILPDDNSYNDSELDNDPFAQKPHRVISQQDLIKSVVRKWEGKFWPKFWKDYKKKLLRIAAATKIQAIIRGFLGRRYYERQLQRALFDMNEFWNRKRELKLLEKEKQRIAKEVRGKVNDLFPLFPIS
jgi:hypothetical protein